MKSPPTLAWARVKTCVLLQRPTDSRWPQDSERLARASQLPTAANVAVQGTALSTAAGRLPLVRLARIRADLRRPLREAPARKQLVRRDEVGRQRAPARRSSPLRGCRAPAHAGRRRASRTSLATRLRRSSRRSSLERWGSAGWYTTNTTVNWTVVDPESIILSTTGCNAVTLTNNTTGTTLVMLRRERRRHDDRREDVQSRQDRAGDDRHTVAIRRLERLVQPRPLRRLRRERHDLRARVVLPGRDLQRA